LNAGNKILSAFFISAPSAPALWVKLELAVEESSPKMRKSGVNS
jgi:hypothetical protein